MENDGHNISAKKYKNLHVKEKTVAFNTSYDFLTVTDFERGFNFKFEDKKPLIDWLINEKDNHEHLKS